MHPLSKNPFSLTNNNKNDNQLKEKTIEKYLFRAMNTSVLLVCLSIISAKILKLPLSHWFAKMTIIICALSLFFMGLWLILGTVYRWRTFKNAYKRIDLERVFGVFGSFLYVFIGFLCFIASILILYLLAP